jgi:hypothetical protein
VATSGKAAAEHNASTAATGAIQLMAIEAAIDLTGAAGFAGGRGGVGVEYISQDPSSRGVLRSGEAFAAAVAQKAAFFGARAVSRPSAHRRADGLSGKA